MKTKEPKNQKKYKREIRFIWYAIQLSKGNEGEKWIQGRKPPPTVLVPSSFPATLFPSWQKFMTDSFSLPPTGETVLAISSSATPLSERGSSRGLSGDKITYAVWGKWDQCKKLFFVKKNCKKKQVRIVGGFSFTVTIARSSQYHSLGKEKNGQPKPTRYQVNKASLDREATLLKAAPVQPKTPHNYH